MKKLILLITLILPIELFAPVSPPAVTVEALSPINPYLPLIEAMSVVESSKNPFAVNIEEQAYGLLQIRQCKLDDFNRANGTDFVLTDMFNVDLSTRVFMWHYSMFDHHDFETIARAWNGSGAMTDMYWKKVKAELYDKTRMMVEGMYNR